MHYVFSSQSAAVLAEAKIVANVQRWVSERVPDALSEDGTKLRGRNAATGQFDDVYTERWAIPVQRQDGKWVFLKPTAEQTAPIPLEVFVEGVTAATEEYSPNWFPEEF